MPRRCLFACQELSGFFDGDNLLELTTLVVNLRRLNKAERNELHHPLQLAVYSARQCGYRVCC